MEKKHDMVSSISLLKNCGIHFRCDHFVTFKCFFYVTIYKFLGQINKLSSDISRNPQYNDTS